MGFQVTPCMNMASSESDADGRKGCASAKYISKDTRIQQLVPIEETKIVLPPRAANYGLFDSSCTSSSSLRSHSANLLLSQCSSLASLPSLGLSLTGSSDPGSCKLLAELASVAANITAHFICLATLTGLGDQVACSVSSPADSSFYSSSSSCASPALKAWSKHGGGSYQSAAFGSKKESAVRALVVAGNQVFSSHDDRKIRVWARPGSSSAHKEQSCIGGGGGGGEHRLTAALPTPWDCLAEAVKPGGYVQVVRHHKKLWIQHADVVSALAVDAKEGCLYSGSWDRSVKVWRLRDFKCVESFRAHDDAINALALSKEGILYTASADCKIKVWARETSTARRRPQHYLVATLEAHRSAVNALALSPDGSLLYSGACDKAIVVWDLEDSAQHASLAGALRGHRQAVLCLAAWGNTLCSGSADKSIRVWQRFPGRFHACVALLQGVHATPVKSLSLCPDDAGSSDADSALTLLSASLDHDVKVWQLRFSLSH